MYQNMCLFLIHIAICIIFLIHEIVHGWIDPIKTIAQNDTPNDTRNKILIHYPVHPIYIKIQFVGDYHNLPSKYAFTETHQINHICLAFSV